jgi:hypothetical protein
MPNTIAAMKPNDRSAASTLSRIASSIGASLLVAFDGGDSLQHGKGTVPVPRSYEARSPLAKQKIFCVAEG